MLSLRSLAIQGGRATRSAVPVPQQSIVVRNKHSSRQVKRLFKKNPAKRRIDLRDGKLVAPTLPSEPSFQPILEPTFLPNGWCPLPGEDVTVPEYPFKVARTKNKPNDSVGFLPVYSEFR